MTGKRQHGKTDIRRRTRKIGPLRADAKVRMQSGTLNRRAMSGARRPRKPFGQVWMMFALLALLAVFALLVPRLFAPRGPAGGPSATPTPVPTETAAAATPSPEPTATATPRPAPTATPTPAPTAAVTVPPQPSLNISDRRSLTELFWWMIYSGEDEVRLKSLSVSRAEIADVADKFSSYFTSCSYDLSRPSVGVTFKTGVRLLQAITQGRTDELDEDERKLAESAQSLVSSLIAPHMSMRERELILHDYICSHCEYSLIGEGGHIGDVRGFFEQGLCQCAGYVDTFRLLARLAGLEVETIGGPTTRDAAGEKGHAWNLIRLDGLWYAVDVTWDDMLMGSASTEHTFFNLPLSAFGRSRTWDQSCCPAGEYADAVDANFYYASPVYRASTAEEGVVRCLSQLTSGRTAYVYFTGTDLSKQVTELLAERSGSSASCTELSADLSISLYKYSLKK
ncbi:MAG: hypothetical protein IJH78_07425 [Clostridia bacterium]|nr:hypothetical protein [Clostridia bacterium]